MTDPANDPTGTESDKELDRLLRRTDRALRAGLDEETDLDLGLMDVHLRQIAEGEAGGNR